MNDFMAIQSTISLLLIWAALSILGGWALLARVPREPRLPVPWNVLDLLVVLGIFELLLGSFIFITQWGLGIPVSPRHASATATSLAKPDGPATPPSLAPSGHPVSPSGHAGPVRLVEDPSAKEETAMNPLLVVLGKRHQPGTLLVCGFVALVAAPVAEEFFFRLLLQGWLEAVEGRWRKRLRLLRRLPPALLPVLLTSALFAAGHFRQETLPGNVDALLALFVLNGLAEVLTVAVAVVYLHFRAGATAADLGLIPQKLPRDLALGLAMVVLCVPLLFSVQLATERILQILHKTVAADPVTLFVFAAVMGIIYFRTHRIAASLVMHVAFNAINLAAAWYLLKP